MSTVDEQQRAASRRQWLAKALFESGFIVLGLVLERCSSTSGGTSGSAPRASMRRSLRFGSGSQNRESIAFRLTSNEELIVTLRALAADGQRYESGIIRPGATDMSSIVRQATRDSGITGDIPLETRIVLGRAYATLDAY